MQSHSMTLHYKQDEDSNLFRVVCWALGIYDPLRKTQSKMTKCGTFGTLKGSFNIRTIYWHAFPITYSARYIPSHCILRKQMTDWSRVCIPVTLILLLSVTFTSLHHVTQALYRLKVREYGTVGYLERASERHSHTLYFSILLQSFHILISY